MRGVAGPAVKRARKERDQKRAAAGWLTVAAAARLVRRPARTIQAWIDGGALPAWVSDHRRYVSADAVTALAEARRRFAMRGDG